MRTSCAFSLASGEGRVFKQAGGEHSFYQITWQGVELKVPERGVLQS